jgi:RNA polymerase subunit RPABC4/transcription elongation factor Spt4
MSLIPCRACNHQVDTSAEACPGCGATNPGRKLSRQQHDLIVLIIQLALGTALLFVGGTVAWNAVGPIIKQQLNKPAP